MNKLDEKKTVLLVDDNPINLNALTSILKDEYKIKVAPSGEKALEIVSKSMPDMILLDIEMPGLSGYEVCKTLKQCETTSDIPVIFVTAKDSDDEEEEGFSLGAVDYITKPFRPSAIKARVKAHLALKAHEQMLKDFNKALIDRVESEVANRMKLNEEKKLQEQILLQQSKMAEMGEMIGAIAHQWKQPINILYMLTGILMDEIEEKVTPSNDSLIKFCKDVQTQAEFMNQTIEDFRKFLSPVKQKEPFMPCESIFQLLRMLEHQFKKQGVKIFIAEHEHFFVQGYPNEFKQVLLNLFKNATDAFEERGAADRKIEVVIKNNKNMGYITVCDNAGGIPEFLLPEKLFEGYVTTKGEKGTGIGLQLVKRIITENFGGNIRVYNSKLGACFEISLPKFISK